MILSAADSVAGKSYGILVNLSKWESSASVYLVKEGCGKGTVRVIRYVRYTHPDIMASYTLSLYHIMFYIYYKVFIK